MNNSENRLSIYEAFQAGLKKSWDNLGLLLFGALTIMAFVVAAGAGVIFLLYVLPRSIWSYYFASFLLWVVPFLVIAYLLACIINSFLKIYDGTQNHTFFVSVKTGFKMFLLFFVHALLIPIVFGVLLGPALLITKDTWFPIAKQLEVLKQTETQNLKAMIEGRLSSEVVHHAVVRFSSEESQNGTEKKEEMSKEETEKLMDDFHEIPKKRQELIKSLRSSMGGIVSFLSLLAILLLGYLFIRFMFSFYSMVDKNFGVIQSLRNSWTLTRANKIQLFLLILILLFFSGITGAIVTGIFNVIGRSIDAEIFALVGFFITLAITLPIIIFSIIHVYRIQLMNQRERIQ